MKEIGFSDVASVKLFRLDYYKLDAEEAIKTVKETTLKVILKYYEVQKL